MKTLSKIILSLLLIASSSISVVLAQNNDTSVINVMTYNIQMGSYYNSTTTPPAVAKIVLNNNIDFLGTQELNVSAASVLGSLLTDYGWFGVGRDDGKATGETVTIFYNKIKYTLLESSTFWLSETPEVVGSRSWNSSSIRIVTWGKFKSNSDSGIVYLFNNHLDDGSSWAREEGSLLLLKKIKEIAGKNPVIITGDFNMESGSQEYKNMVASYQGCLQFYDTKYKATGGCTGPSGTYNEYTNPNPTSKIDYVFVNRFFNTLTLDVLTDKYSDGKYISDHYPVKVRLTIKRPCAPVTPTLKAVAGNKKVALYWDDVSEKKTVETFTDSTNDFEGYKLYKSTTPDMNDALLVPGKWDVQMLRKPLLECDLKNDKYGYTDYGIVDGFGYYLGNNSGIQHYYYDEDVTNGQTYYYVLVAYDYGIPELADGFAPMETPYTLKVGNDGRVISKSSNVDVATPSAPEQGSQVPVIKFESTDVTGTGSVSARIVDPSQLKQGSYKIKFDIDTLAQHAVSNEKYRSPRDIYYINTGIKVLSADSDSVIYEENKDKYTAQNIAFNNYKNYYFLNTSTPVITEEVDGFQIVLDSLVEKAEFDTIKSKWKIGNSDITVTPSSLESLYFPWNCEIRFGEQYQSLTNSSKSIYDANGAIVPYTMQLLNKTFDFTVVNKDFPGEKLDMVILDENMNGTFDYANDKILVGYCVTLANKTYWAGTEFVISFENATAALPNAGDIYEVYFKRPFISTDSLIFSVGSEIAAETVSSKNGIPSEFALIQNYPNPFNPSTTISYKIAKPGIYRMDVYNILGEKVQTLFNSFFKAGNYSMEFNAKKMASGVYFYCLQGEGKNQVRKMLLLK